LAARSRRVWCKACRHQVEPDVAEQLERYGAGLALPGLGRAAAVHRMRRSRR
jgi:hypothetical protein